MYQPEQPIFDEQPESNIEVTIGIEDVPKPWWKSWYFALQITLVDFTPFMWVSGFASLAARFFTNFSVTLSRCGFFDDASDIKPPCFLVFKVSGA